MSAAMSPVIGISRQEMQDVTALFLPNSEAGKNGCLRTVGEFYEGKASAGKRPEEIDKGAF